MSESPQLGEVLEGYLETAQELLADWTPYVTGVSAKLSAGSYGQPEAAADFPAFAKLVAESAFKAGGQLVRTMAVLGSDFSTTSTEGGYVIEAQKVAVELTLSLKGDLKSVTGQVLPADRVTIVPATLVPPATDFALVVDAQGIKARTYDGFVVAKNPAGAVVQTIPVSRTVG